ncbi:aminopeptidase P family protein [Rhizobium sp. CG5]|uniref:M24 family metallopeptidase n=1 Tax=Rhizobium sp. CG5 TaxID=2726076 RepID=UPI0020348A4F|nr:aminopeptidase P family protein [Rhizobium sp. CG5]MCM2477364.1 aminopeptidase P family protein [Rhizobium sp. CG5]
MNAIITPHAGNWEEVRHRLDQNAAFNRMRGTPYYRDAIYEQFSAAEYKRRYDALRAKMREMGLQAAIVPGGPSHWSWGGGMLWLTGHWEWHALACYVLVPLEGEPTLVYSMGGTHCEATRREVAAAIADVRGSRGGKYAEVMIERLKELGLERARIGLLEVDPRHQDHMPWNQVETLKKGLPHAEIVMTHGIMHELLSVHSTEELDCVRQAGKLVQAAMEALIERARSGIPEYKLRAAAGAAILEGGGDIDFLIIGSTPMADPAMVFGNPRPSQRVLQHGDIINMELAASYRGYTAQIGSPVCIGQPPIEVSRFWNDIAKPGFELMAATLKPGANIEDIRKAGDFFRENGVQSRPIHAHGIDLVSDGPHIFKEQAHAEPFEQVLRPGMVIMPEPNPITPDGLLGMFVGHTYIITQDGAECVDDFPLDLIVAE